MIMLIDALSVGQVLLRAVTIESSSPFRWHRRDEKSLMFSGKPKRNEINDDVIGGSFIV